MSVSKTLEVFGKLNFSQLLTCATNIKMVFLSFPIKLHLKNFFPLWYKIVSSKYKCVFPTANCVETHSLRAYSHSALAMPQRQYMFMPHVIWNSKKDSQEPRIKSQSQMLNVNMTQDIKKHLIVAIQFCLSHMVDILEIYVYLFFSRNIYFYIFQTLTGEVIVDFFLFVASRYCVCVRRNERDTSECARRLLPFVPSLEDGR